VRKGRTEAGAPFTIRKQGLAWLGSGVGGRDTLKWSPGSDTFWGGRAIISEQTIRNSERGSVNMKTLLGFLVLAAFVFAGFKIVPVYIENYQFQDSMQTEARFALSGWPKKSEDDIREDLWKEMQKEGIPARKEDLHISVQQSLVNITLDYTVPIDLKLFQWSPEFHLHADNHTI
jgi:Domain of unknown function (DUF4845)